MSFSPIKLGKIENLTFVGALIEVMVIFVYCVSLVVILRNWVCNIRVYQFSVAVLRRTLGAQLVSLSFIPISAGLKT